MAAIPAALTVLKRLWSRAVAVARATLTSLKRAENRPAVLASATAVVVIGIGLAAWRFTPRSLDSLPQTESTTPAAATTAPSSSSPPPSSAAPVSVSEPALVAPVSPAAQEPTTETPITGTVQPVTPPRAQAPPTVDPGVIAAVRRSGETLAAWRRRSKELTDRYAQAKAALSRSEFDQAAKLFTGLLADEPGFADATSLLTAAQEGSRAAARAEARARAQTEFEEGARREKSDDLAGALARYRQAQRADATFEAAGSAIAALTPRIQAAAADTYRRANVDDAFGRAPSAIALYKRVVELLPENDPLRIKAQARLDVLQGSKP